MADCTNDNHVEIFENGSGVNRYGYTLDIRTEPATVVVTPQLSELPVLSVSNSNSENVSSHDRDKLRSNPNKRCKMGDGFRDVLDKDSYLECGQRRELHLCMELEENVPEEEESEDRDEDQPFDSLGTKRKSPQVIKSKENGDGDIMWNGVQDWSQNLDRFPAIPAFTGEPGLHLNRQDDYSMLDCFRFFITDWLLKHLQEQTNKYANDMQAANTDQLDKEGRNILKDWKPVTLTEMKGFIVILLHMGVVKKRSIDDYWCQDVFIASPFATQIFSRERFRSIMNMLNMNDNHTYIPASRPGHDPLHKIRPVYSHLQERFQQVYTPNKNLAIDDITYFNSSSSSSSFEFCKVQLGSKLTGVKLYKLCECDSGYVFRFELSGDTLVPSNPDKDDDNICGSQDSMRIIQTLMSPIIDKGYHIYTHSDVTSPALYQTLTDNNTMCTGILSDKENDDVPDNLRDEELSLAGQIAFRRKGKLCALKWIPSDVGKPVYILTSAHHPLDTVTRKEKSNKNSNDVTSVLMGKPLCVAEYSKNMASIVDKMDQVSGYFPLTQQPLKWTKRVFLHLLTLCVKQAMVVYNKLQEAKGGKLLPLSLFVKALGKQLSEDYIADRGQPVPSLYVASLTEKPNPVLRTDHTHFHHLVSLPPNPVLSKKPRKSCRVCLDVINRIRMNSAPGVHIRFRRTVGHWCAVCKVALCIEPCFYIYHNEGDYISIGADMEYFKTMALEGCNLANEEGF